MWGMRHPRILQKGARYHVTVRANRREMILDKEGMKDLFLSVLREAEAKYDFQLENISIMGNHIHFIIKPGDEECLSSIMQWICGVFAMRFNRRWNLTGHVWGERFKSRIIEGIREFRRVFSYIDNNPVEAKLVNKAEDWLYSRFRLDRLGWGDLLSSPPGDLDCP
jgi:putative transposase